jgi:hypothetical protein
MTWATVASIVEKTGITPGSVAGLTTTAEGTVTLAQRMIETSCGRTPAAADSFTLKDIQHLEMAVAWQAIWLPSQPGILARMGAANVSQDGMSSNFNSPVDMFLAPLAQRELKSCSWMGPRTLRTRPRQALDEAGTLSSAGSFLREGTDAEDGWQPL